MPKSPYERIAEKFFIAEKIDSCAKIRFLYRFSKRILREGGVKGCSFSGGAASQRSETERNDATAYGQQTGQQQDIAQTGQRRNDRAGEELEKPDHGRSAAGVFAFDVEREGRRGRQDHADGDHQQEKRGLQEPERKSAQQGRRAQNA